MSKVELFQGDCLDLIKDIPDGSVDCIITDPPYGTTNCDWDKRFDLNRFFKESFSCLKKNGALVVFSQQPFSTDLVNAGRKFFRYEIIWHKTRATGFLNARKMPLRAHENILVFYRKLPTYNPVFSVKKAYLRVSGGTSEVYGKIKDRHSTKSDGKRYPHDVIKMPHHNFGLLHPTQKPVELTEWLVKTYTNPGDTVLDCFMGSGTTGVACVCNGRNFIGMELQEKYFEIAKNRIEDEIKRAENHAECEPFWNLSTGENNIGVC